MWPLHSRLPYALRLAALAPLAAAVAAGCRDAPSAPPADASPPVSSAAVAVPVPLPLPPETATVDASSDARAASGDDEAAFLSGIPKSAKSIGHTSVVFKVELSTGKKAVFKPASRRGPLRYKGEIAARRLALAFGIPNVPPAYFRTFELKTLAGAAHADEVIAPAGITKGALIPWLDHLDFIALEQAPLSLEWKQWLRRGASIPDDQRRLASQISTLVAFDFVTANWDRWSGGNVGIDKSTGTLLYIDNDGAFFEVPPLEGLQRNKRLLEGIDRFSKSFVEKLRALDDDALGRAIGEESPGVPLLSAKAMAGVVQRRKTALAIIDAKTGDGGEDATLAFP